MSVTRLVILAVLLLSCSREVVAPDRFTDAPNDALLQRYHCSDVFDAQPFKVLVYREHDTDYKIIFYKRAGAEWVQHGAEFDLLGHDSLQKPTARDPFIRVRHVASGSRYHFEITSERGPDIVPDAGIWQPVGDSTPVQIHDVGGEVSAPVRIKTCETVIPPSVRGQKIVQPFFIYEAVITADGDVQSLRLVKGRSGQPYDELDRAFRQSIMCWKFKPAMLRGRPVPCRYTMTATAEVR